MESPFGLESLAVEVVLVLSVGSSLKSLAHKALMENLLHQRSPLEYPVLCSNLCEGLLYAIVENSRVCLEH